MKRLFLVLLLLLASPAWAEDYYVSSVHASRSDAGAGTNQSAPWETFGKIITEWGGAGDIQPGDTVHLDQGSVWTFSETSAQYFVMADGGSPGLPMTIRGDDYDSGTSSGKPILRNTATPIQFGQGRFFEVNASYITIRDLTIDGSGNGFTGVRVNTEGAVGDLSNVNVLNLTIINLGSFSDHYDPGIWLNANSDTISDCLIEGNDVSGHVSMGLNSYSNGGGRVDNNTWRNNYVHDHSTTIGSGQGGPTGAVQTVRGGTGNIWEYNYLQDDQSERIWLSNVDNDGADADDDVIIRYNIFEGGGTGGPTENYGYVLGIGAGSDGDATVDFYGNIVRNCTRWGLIIQAAPDVTSGTVRIYNNTFYANHEDGLDWAWSQIRLVGGALDEVILKNNLFFLISDRNNHSSIRIESGFTPTVTTGNNLYWSDQGTSGGAVSDARPTAVNYSIDATNPVTDFEATAQNSDPLMKDTGSLPTSVTRTTDPSPDGLEVGASSPARANGSDLGTIYEMGIAGYINTTAPNIGAYQK